jgi:hypothetical protein
MFSWKGIRQEFKKSKSEKSYAFRLFDSSSSLSTLNGLSFVLWAAHVRLERHPAKNQKVKK